MSRTATPWPRLSLTLPGPRDLRHCQNCSAMDLELARWMEHDENDKPEPIVIVLCGPCVALLIEPHPRLYREMEINEPVPGACPICEDCRHQAGLRCINSRARINGGPGLAMRYPTPTLMHIDGTDKSGRRTGWTTKVWPGPVSFCDGKELLDPLPIAQPSVDPEPSLFVPSDGRTNATDGQETGSQQDAGEGRPA